MAIAPENVFFQAATPEQADAAASLLFDTDPHLFACFFGNDHELALRFFSSQWAQERNLFSHQFSVAAVVNDKLVGIELGFDRETQEQAGHYTAQHVSQILSPLDLKQFLEAVSYIPYLMPPTPEDAYYILHLATVPEVRGLGVGARLLDNAFMRARQNGFRFCHLDVASDNPAVAFYKRMGMDILSESRVVPLLEQYAVSSHYRMVKRL